jgi:hypothetical protein
MRTSEQEHSASGEAYRPLRADFDVSLRPYPADVFNFASIISTLLKEPDLQRLGINQELSLRTRATDQKTRWHGIFYETFPSWRPLYERFIREIIGPALDDKFYYQAIPTFRVHLPDNVAVGEFHTDADYGHPEGAVTFWVPLTPAFDTNSMWVESRPGKGDYRSVDTGPGTIVVFDAVHLRHGNLPNKTGVTRVSFDFRCLRQRDYFETDKRSINTNLRFAPGGYYAPQLVEPGR